MLKNIIYNLFEPIKLCKSQMAVVWAQRLNADIAIKTVDLIDYDNIYLFHNSKIPKVIDDEIISRFYNLFDAMANGANLYSLGINIHKCKYVDLIQAKENKKGNSEMLNEDFTEKVAENLSLCRQFFMSDLNLSKAIIGNNYVLQYQNSKQAVYIDENWTLESILKLSLNEFLKQNLPKNKNLKKFDEITLCFKSEKLLAQNCKSFKSQNKILVKNFAKEIINFQEKNKIKISVCEIPNPFNLPNITFFNQQLSEYFLDFELLTLKNL